MKPLFTIHAGKFLVGEAIERRFPTVNVWVPAKDTGVDLLVSDASNQRAVSLQVKFSRDYLATHMKDEISIRVQGRPISKDPQGHCIQSFVLGGGGH